MAQAHQGREKNVILIVEDDALMRFSLRSYVQRAYPDWSLEEAVDGAGAISACVALRPHLILMDLNLPDANGIDLIPRVLALLPAAKVIMVSSETGAGYIRRALAAGAFDYITKDTINSRLLPAIARALA